MPVTLQIVEHPATGWEKPRVASAEDLLKGASPRNFRRCERIIQSSFSRGALREHHTSASENGFVWSAYHAYSNHHHLTIRPEDVWFAILTQLSFFINANAEQLRAFFVSHEGKKELEVVAVGTLESANFGSLAQQMTGLISKNVNDPELGTWVMPSFSTTSDTDRVVASVLFMGAMQKYFSYTITLVCGIPSVTLLGEVSDWKDIQARLAKIEQLGEEPTQFAEMLRPILRHLILSFEQPNSPDVTRFWNTIATKNPMFSGTDYISGWIGAFCFWEENGASKPRFKEDVVLDGVSYPTVDIDKVPVGFASVPVTVNDNDAKFECTMLAGSFGIQAQPSSQEGLLEQGSTESEPQGHETSTSALVKVQPLSGWIMYENEAAEAAQAREEEKKVLNDKINTGMEASGPEGFSALLPLYRRLEELEAF
ncbi:hypothetical protein FOBRF1_007099 [Fusarium oxysporum]